MSDERQPGYRWSTFARYEPSAKAAASPVPSAVGPITIANADGEPLAFELVGYGVADERGDERPEFFESQDDADALRDRLNREDAEAVLDPAFRDRRSRLRKLGKTFTVRYGGQGHPDSRWPSQPGRYAVEEFSERYDESFWDTVETREEIEARILEGDVERVVDLDTGDEIPFVLSVALGEPGDERGDA